MPNGSVAPKPQVSRPAPAEVRVEVPTPTIVGSLSHGKHTVAERHVPDGTPWAFGRKQAEKALHALTGVPPHYRLIAELQAGIDSGGDPIEVLPRVLRAEPNDEQVRATTAYVDSLRGSDVMKPAARLQELLVAIGIPTASPDAAEKLKNRALKAAAGQDNPDSEVSG